MAASGPPRDRRKPLRPRQIILAVLAALGVGALLSSGALVGLAERQPLSTQRDVALGAAKVADRVAHLLSLNRPASELAAALDETEEVYDVEALIARARAAAPAAPDPPPVPDAAGEGQPTVPAETDEATADTAIEPGEGDSDTGPPEDGISEQVDGIDCVPESDAEPRAATGDRTEGSAPEDQPGEGDPTDGATAPAVTDDLSDEEGSGSGTDPGGAADASENPGVEDAQPDAIEAPSPAATADDGSARSGSPTEPASTERAGEPEGDSGGAADEDGTEPSDPTACPPGYVPAGLTEAQTDTDTSQETDPAAENTTTAQVDDGEPPLFDAPRAPDEDDPLTMYVGGDSISRDLGEGLARVTPAGLVRIDLDPRPATGLSRPDFFDWSQHLAGVLTESVPDVIVVLFGANDFQNVEYEGEILDRFGDEWLELYRRRVERIMTLLSQPDTQTVWVGQPPVRESRLSSGLARMNTVYEEVAAEHPQVTYLDTWALFSDDEGGYTDEIEGVRLRREDGVHLTIAGGNRLARAVWDVIGPAWGLDG